MGYATQQDLIDRFGAEELIQRTDRVNYPPTTVDPVVVSRALADADALIDSHLAKLYALPLSSIPTSVVKAASDIARYYLHGEAAGTDGPVHRAYRDAVKWLLAISQGIVLLDVAGAAPAQAGGGEVRWSGSPRTFSRNSLRGM